MGAALFVLVAGPPGSGKSTLARPLAARLGLPLLDKDAIKEALFSVLGPPADVDESRQLGRAAVMALLSVAARCPAGAVLDSTFYPYAVPSLRALNGSLVEIRCRCPREVVRARYAARAPTRGPGHFDADRPEEELFSEHHDTPLGLGPLIEVDTSGVVDVEHVAEQVLAAAGG
jgi:predicted kinase